MDDQAEQLATPEDRARIEGRIWGLELAHSIASSVECAERIAELIRDMRGLVTHAT